MAGASGPRGCVQKFMRFQVLTPVCVSALVTCKDCEVGRQVEALCQSGSSYNRLRAVGAPEHALAQVPFKPKHGRIVRHGSCRTGYDRMLQIA